MPTPPRTLLALALAAGCAEDPQSVGQFFGTEGASSPADSGTGSGSGASDPSVGSDASDEADDTLDGDTSGYKFDTPSGMTAADDGPSGSGCEKVDFLFVLDNSISMGDEQQNLAASFPSFIATIQNDVVDNFHVMVVDTDPEDKWDEELTECHSGDCDGEDADEPCGVLEPESGWPCGMLPVPDVCDGVRGAGIDHDGTNARSSCGITDDKRWFDDNQPDAPATFECVANLYDGNNPETTMESMLAALAPEQVGAGGCNEGFLRDDAVLVVTFITDEEDDTESLGDPGTWYADLLARKNGNETALVVLGLVGDTGLPGAVCPPDSVPGSNGGEYSPRLIEFAESWGSRGSWGSVCSPDYGDFFAAAVAVVDTACDEYEPEG
ncbi:MAG: hypothetical protein IAG13_28900 [Deltaproteobacteria bacterium]|nr:hypothetical protein [Nannocystaceae bacterium]